jgi:hypothetical protein
LSETLSITILSGALAFAVAVSSVSGICNPPMVC